MICGACNNCDSTNIYLTNPPKIKCKISGKLHFVTDCCDLPTTDVQPVEVPIPSQEAKADAGKLQLTMVPSGIIREIAKIRMYGNAKYNDPENWRTVDPERYRDAAYRHWLAYLDDPGGVDEESGLPHLSHMACNIAFLIELEGIDG